MDASESGYSSVCDDFYVKARLDLRVKQAPDDRTVMDFFERMRRVAPSFTGVKKIDTEWILEAPLGDQRMEWVAVGPGAVRCGAVNPIRVSASYELATNVLEALPGYFGINALDVVSLELTFGFDLDTDQDHYEAVHDTLLGGSRLAGLMRCDEERVVEMQPMLAWSLDHSADLQAQVEVRPRGKGSGVGNVESCSVYSTVKRTGPVERFEDPGVLVHELAGRVEALASDRVIPEIVMLLRARFLI